MVGADCVLAKPVSAASARIAKLNFIFIKFVLSCGVKSHNVMLTYITGAPGATLGFADRLVVGSEVLAGLAAPVDPAGKLVLGLAGRLIKHFLAAQVAAEHLQFR